MKKIFTFIIALMACASAMTAQASDDKSTPIPIAINTPPDNSIPKPKIHRSPMRIPVEGKNTTFNLY